MGSRLNLTWLLLLAHLSVALCSFNVSECGNAKKCTYHPENCLSAGGSLAGCNFIFSYRQISTGPGGPIVEMDLVGRITSSEEERYYVAFGFSDDDSMGDEPVIACVFQQNGIGAQPTLSRNIGQTNIPLAEPTGATLELVEFSVSDGFSHCRIRQDFGMNVDAKFRVDPKKQNVLLGAMGPANSDNQLSYHNTRFVIKRNVRLSDSLPKIQSAADMPALQDNQSPPKDESFSFGWSVPTIKLLIRLHGLFMIIAWLVCVSLAVFSARYLRDTFGTQINGIKLWFHVHRTLNVVAVLLIIAAVAMVATALNLKWTGPWFTNSSDTNLTVGAWHSLFGGLSTLLAIMQPFNSLLRCSPDHPRRSVFNVFHRVIGLLGLTFAFVALFIAVFKFTRHFTSGPELAKWVLVAATALAIALVVVAELVACRGVRKRVAAIELTTPNNGKAQRNDTDAFSYEDSTAVETRTQKTANRLIFVAFALVVVGSAVVLAVLIE